MSRIVRVVIVAAVVVAAGLVLASRQRGPSGGDGAVGAASDGVVQAPVESAPAAAEAEGLPRLIELGSVSCIPCQMMAPILEELRKEYAGKLKVDFIDVWQDTEAARRYGIRVIPTQVFLDASGQEVFRHEGFFPKEDILARWKELGVELIPPAGGGPGG